MMKIIVEDKSSKSEFKVKDVFGKLIYKMCINYVNTDD